MMGAFVGELIYLVGLGFRDIIYLHNSAFEYNTIIFIPSFSILVNRIA